MQAAPSRRTGSRVLRAPVRDGLRASGWPDTASGEAQPGGSGSIGAAQHTVTGWSGLAAPVGPLGSGRTASAPWPTER